jgi:hypothetical protein
MRGCMTCSSKLSVTRVKQFTWPVTSVRFILKNYQIVIKWRTDPLHVEVTWSFFLKLLCALYLLLSELSCLKISNISLLNRCFFTLDHAALFLQRHYSCNRQSKNKAELILSFFKDRWVSSHPQETEISRQWQNGEVPTVPSRDFLLVFHCRIIPSKNAKKGLATLKTQSHLKLA